MGLSMAKVKVRICGFTTTPHLSLLNVHLKLNVSVKVLLHVAAELACGIFSDVVSLYRNTIKTFLHNLQSQDFLNQ